MISLGSGRYRLDRRIAAGGMGEVWHGTDTALGREVAVKLLHRNLSDDPMFRARFEAEARHTAALHDPHIAAIFDYGDEVDEHGAHRSYLVMEYVDGQPLSALLRGPLPPDQAAHLIAQAADALAVAHAAGIVHRDVKPANLLVRPDRQVKITDFGVARAMGGTSLTETGTVIGTAAYVAPEVAEGREATAQSDIYSLGVVLYECLAGRRPFTGDNPVAVAIAHLRDEPPPLPDSVPAGLQAVVADAMAKDPAQRPGGAAALASRIRQAAGGGLHASTMPLPVPEPPPHTAAAAIDDSPGDDPGTRGRRVWPWVAAAAAVLLIIVGIAAATAFDDETPSGADPSQETLRSLGTPADTSEGSTPPETTPSETTVVTETETTQTTETTAPSEETSSTTEEPETVSVVASDYVGRDATEVTQELRNLGLRPSREFVDGDGEPNTVADVQPTGDLPLDSDITVYVLRDSSGEGDGDGDGDGEGEGGDDED